MSRKKWIQIGVVAGILAVAIVATFIVYPLASMFFGVARFAKEIKKAEARLQSPHIYEPVAKRLALYCQSDQQLFPEFLSDAWFPAELQEVGGGWGKIQPSHAKVEMGGGFHHFGYHLQLSETKLAGELPTLMEPTPKQTNLWELFLYSEGSNDKLLTRLPLLASERLTHEGLHALVEAGYDRLISNHPGAYKGKVMTLLRFGKTRQAADECRRWMEVQPDHWLPRFTLAHLRCRLGENTESAAEFADWIHANNNFAHCIYLALFNFREGRTNEALNAVRLALHQRFVEPPGTSGNKFYLGHNGAFIAYLASDYDLCITTCDKVLADRRKEESWRDEVSRLRTSAIKMKDRETTTVIPARPEKYKPRNEFGDWFTPFNTDEAGWHGSKAVPSPFPENWRDGGVDSN